MKEVTIDLQKENDRLDIEVEKIKKDVDELRNELTSKLNASLAHEFAKLSGQLTALLATRSSLSDASKQPWTENNSMVCVSIILRMRRCSSEM